MLMCACVCIAANLYRLKSRFFLKGIVCTNSKITQFIIDSHLNGVSGDILQSTVAEMH